nr:DUF5117 domain-containing protein [Saprospiraceae bacterium]
MKQALYCLFLSLCFVALQAQESSSLDLNAMDHADGFIPFHVDAESGKIYLSIDRFDQELLYTVSLATGVGSNDIGLDRGRLGGSRVVKFTKVGNRVMLREVNYGYRALSDNVMERLAVEEAFAESILWGFKIAQMEGDVAIVDATDFLVRDAYDVAGGLSQRGQGSYRMDASRSFLYAPRTKNFPKNTEIEATITVTGTPKGREVRSVTPDANSVTVRQHHSFVELPDDQYEPRVFDPRSGYMAVSFYDYATPIDQPIVKKYIRRHRLEKKDPSAALSEAVEPI